MSNDHRTSRIRPGVWAVVLGVFAVLAVTAWLSREKERLPIAVAPTSQEGKWEKADRVNKPPSPNQRIEPERSPEAEIAVAEPSYEGAPLSVWLGILAQPQMRWEDSETYDAAIAAVRAIGPQAIPSLLKALEVDEAARKGACNAFMALGGQGEAAVPELFQLVEKYPGYAPSALASIGAPAVPFLQECLDNNTLFGGRAIIPGNTMVGIFNAISVGGIPASEFYPLLPKVLEVAKSDNPHSVRYAEDLRELLLARIEDEVEQQE